MNTPNAMTLEEMVAADDVRQVEAEIRRWHWFELYCTAIFRYILLALTVHFSVKYRLTKDTRFRRVAWLVFSWSCLQGLYEAMLRRELGDPLVDHARTLQDVKEAFENAAAHE